MLTAGVLMSKACVLYVCGVMLFSLSWDHSQMKTGKERTWRLRIPVRIAPFKACLNLLVKRKIYE
jgi:hypothetical protein